MLEHYLPQLKLSAGDQVLVPLCGKSLDMGWIIKRRLRVLGIELSAIAIEAFFDTQKVIPTRQAHRNFIRWQHKDCEIWCGDIFDLRLKDMRTIKLIYDCMALTAMPAKTREQYVAHFTRILPKTSPILLLTTETPDEQVANSVSTIDSEVHSLYQKDYQIALLHGKNCFKIDPEYPEDSPRHLEEKVYLMHRLASLP